MKPQARATLKRRRPLNVYIVWARISFKRLQYWLGICVNFEDQKVLPNVYTNSVNSDNCNIIFGLIHRASRINL